ncbi:MAG: hypothetical protein HN348_30205 [Proteobacteria bacterium]|jgi:hypothetical protein|nr:hypothetical protein [Pseudomonadota bacterium]
MGKYARAFARLLHVNDRDRLDAWRIWLHEPAPVPPVNDEERALQRQLVVGLGYLDCDMDELGDVLAKPALPSSRPGGVFPRGIQHRSALRYPPQDGNGVFADNDV